MSRAGLNVPWQPLQSFRSVSFLSLGKGRTATKGKCSNNLKLKYCWIARTLAVDTGMSHCCGQLVARDKQLPRRLQLGALTRAARWTWRTRAWRHAFSETAPRQLCQLPAFRLPLPAPRSFDILLPSGKCQICARLRASNPDMSETKSISAPGQCRAAASYSSRDVSVQRRVKIKPVS